MEECEICGKPTATQYGIQIEGTEMRVCKNCSEGKAVIAMYGKVQAEKTQRPAYFTRKQEIPAEDEMVDNYGERIRKARESLSLSMMVVAEKLNEKESTLRRVEEEKMLPGPVLVKKLEKELGIKLVRPAELKQKAEGYSKAGSMTLDDVAFKKEKK